MGKFRKLLGLETEAPKKPAPAPKVEAPKDEPELEEEVSTDEESD